MITTNTCNLQMEQKGVSKSIKTNCTEFTLHKRYYSTSYKNVIDFSEKKLVKFIETINDQQQKLFLIALLKDYIDGNVALAWKKGIPLYFKVVKDK